MLCMNEHYQQTPEELYQKLDACPEGLSAETAAKHLEQYGKNAIAEAKKTPTWLIFLEQFKDFLVIILIIAALISAFTGDLESFIVIIAVITMNAILGTVQTVKAEKSLSNLKKLSSPTAKVLRDGQTVVLPAEEVTVGDLVLLEAGDQIPADGRLVDCASLQTNESALTGESTNVEKTADCITGEVPLAERKNMVYSGGLSIFSAMDPDIQAICDSVASDESLYPDGMRWLLSYQLTYRDPDSEEEGGIVNISSEKYKSYYQENGDKNFNLLYSSQEEANEAIEAYKAATIPDSAEIIGESITLTPQPQISLTIEDQSTGYVVAMIGGRGTKEGNLTLNRSTDAVRQPGSTFKIVSTYAPALDSAGMTLADVEVDGPFNYDNGRPVSNWYSSGYRGICSLRDGIRDSLNIVTVKVLTQITPRLGYEYLQKFGFTTLVDGVEKNGKIFSDVQQALALGGITYGVKNIELNASYATIANGGQYIRPKLYTIVKDHDGNVILDNTSTEGTQVIKPSTAFLLTSAMQDVVTSGTGTAVNFGGMSIAGKTCQLDNMTVAGKTGTTEDYNDLWFVGYTPYYTCTTWTGYDNNTKLRKGEERSLAKKLWKAVMSQVHEGLENKSFSQPADIVAQTVCAKSGKLPTALCGETLKTEYFAVDTVPTETCDVHYQGSVCAYSGLPAADACPFATEGTLEMLPENERILTGQVTSEDSQRVCEHSSVFMATPGADQIIEQERLELQLRTNSAQYESLLLNLQQQLQTAVEDKAIADQELAAAADDNAKAAAQSAVDEAQHRIDSLNTQINQLNAAQTSVQTQSAAAAPSSDGSAADNVPVDDGNAN